jgi:glycosyltransferase involved in cell wall biosynthesis
MVGDEMKIAIVMPVLNQFRLAIECIESIRTTHETIIIPILNYQLDLPLSGAWNLGINKALNLGVDYVLVINDDILFSPWTIDNLVSTFERADENIIMVTGHNVRGEITDAEEIFSWPQPLEPVERDNPDFACFLVRPTIFDIVGTFDETFSPAYFEDNDYHRRISLAGRRAVCTTSAPYYHYGSKTQNADPIFPTVPPFIFQANQLHYVNKWGGSPGAEAYNTPFNNPEMTYRDW